MCRHHFSLLLFSVDPLTIRRASDAGVEGFVVDWERAGKHRRQEGADTEINAHTVEDLRRVRRSTDALVICRINAPHSESVEEVAAAVGEGADELLVPMVRGAREVEVVMRIAGSRCGVGILIETNDAVNAVGDFTSLPLSRVYIGLNDLAIERGSRNIFTPLIDGTVDRVRGAIGAPFGVGGLTLPEGGSPIPCRLLIAEMARLDCHFSFLR